MSAVKGLQIKEFNGSIWKTPNYCTRVLFSTTDFQRCGNMDKADRAFGASFRARRLWLGSTGEAIYVSPAIVLVLKDTDEDVVPEHTLRAAIKQLHKIVIEEELRDITISKNDCKSVASWETWKRLLTEELSGETLRIWALGEVSKGR